MKNYLPKLFFQFIVILLIFKSFNPLVSAQTMNTFESTPIPTPDIIYTPDPEVNFVGKTAARAVAFLNWTLQNYEWSCYIPSDPSSNQRLCQNDQNPLRDFWKIIRDIVYAFFALLILITAFVLIATRGKSLTMQRFFPRFVAVMLLVTMSYAIIQMIYTATDIIQGFFLTKSAATATTPGELISAVDLLYVGWNYEDFRGLRKVDPYFDESVFVNLLLARLTAVTYYAMTGVLIIRKIILWFFIVLSPVFPILLLYYPVRNTAKIWIGEFFRWLLYAPLFSIFLSGLVALWKSERLPLIFNFSGAGTKFVYPTATNVLLGGPGQVVTEANNLNLPDTFALYVVALIMLWVVVLLPFILLQIFLDYMNNFSFGDSPALQKIINTSYMMLNKTPPSPLNPLGPGPSGTTGMAKSLPFAKYSTAKIINQEFPAGEAKAIPIGNFKSEMQQSVTVTPSAASSVTVNTELLNATNLSLPTIRDIASYERTMLSSKEMNNSSVSQTVQALRQIANPSRVQNEIERDRFSKLKERLVKESTLGNNVASVILSAANVASNVTNNNVNNVKNLRKSLTNIANPSSVTNVSEHEKETLTKLHDSLVKESEKGNIMASTILASKENSTVRELQSIKQQLTRESTSGNNIATSVLATSFTKEHESVLRNVLTQVANPANVTSGVNKETINNLHEALVRESSQGNTLASTILSSKESATSEQIKELKEKLIEATLQGDQTAASILSTTISQIDARSTQKIIQQIANPNSVMNSVDRDRFESVRVKLYDAQKQGNSFATSMVSTMNMISQQQSTSVHNALQQLANPAAGISVSNPEKYNSLHNVLREESNKGNTLATSILGINEMTSEDEFNNLKNKIDEEQANGNPLASEVASLMDVPANPEEMKKIKDQLQTAKANGEPLADEVMNLLNEEETAAESVAAPQTNRIQSVSLEDYEAVRKMWEENFKDLDLPQGVTGRKEWVNSEINDIDNILTMLSSDDQEKVQEGMQEVGNILPFLMLGGFSQEEIVAYLKAKKEAGKSVLEVLVNEENEEDTLVTVDKHTTKTATMTQSQAVEIDADDDFTASPLTDVAVNMPKANLNTQLLQLTNLPMPTMKDVVKFEISMLSKNANNKNEVTQVKEILQQLANPTTISTQEERERIENVRNTLIQNSQQGDELAATIVKAINHEANKLNAAPILISTTKEAFQQLINPSLVGDEKKKEKFNSLHDKLVTESQNGNELATSVLALSDTSTQEEIQLLKEKILNAKNNADPLASDLAELLPTQEPVQQETGLPKENRLQSVSLDDYEAVRQLWEENYKNVDVPVGMDDRSGWIKQDMNNIDNMIEMMSSNDPEKVKQGMQEVGNLLPFLMLGGFSQEEIIAYLKAKKEAGKSVLKVLEENTRNEEETVVTVETKPVEVTVEKVQEAVVDTNENKEVDQIKTSQPAIANKELLELTNLPLPSIKDLVTFETSQIKDKKGEANKIQELLIEFNNPEEISNEERKAKTFSIKDTLKQKSEQGDQHAKLILQAVEKVKSKVDESSLSLFHKYLLQINKPEDFPASQNDEDIKNINHTLKEEVKKKNILADRIMCVTNETPKEQIEELKDEIHNESEAGNQVAQLVWKHAPKEALTPSQGEGVGILNLPETNPLQTVNLQDYEDVRSIWEDFYRKTDAPKGMSDKKDWLRNESENIRSVLMLINSNEKDRIQDGLMQVSMILPMVLLGGFTITEITAYLDAKLNAANSVLQTLPNQPEEYVSVNKEPEKEKSAEAAIDESK